ncbi:MAG: hypothetical protein R6W31_01015 [Bacteroidales bacterium]
MITRSLISAMFMMLLLAGASAQDQKQILKITDLKGVTTVVTNASSSSSSSCNSPDFPVLRGGTRKDINFRELSWITVVHDQSARDPEIYIKVELTLKNGTVEEYEMIRNIRFTGKSGQDDFSILVEEINTVQIQSL